MKRREQIFWIFDAAHEKCSISHFLAIRTGKLFFFCRTQHIRSHGMMWDNKRGRLSVRWWEGSSMISDWLRWRERQKDKSEDSEASLTTLVSLMDILHALPNQKKNRDGGRRSESDGVRLDAHERGWGSTAMQQSSVSPSLEVSQDCSHWRLRRPPPPPSPPGPREIVRKTC